MKNCQLCGEPMPENEQMFKFHGYSGPCPKPPLPRKQSDLEAALSRIAELEEVERELMKIINDEIDYQRHTLIVYNKHTDELWSRIHHGDSGERENK